MCKDITNWKLKFSSFSFNNNIFAQTKENFAGTCVNTSPLLETLTRAPYAHANVQQNIDSTLLVFTNPRFQLSFSSSTQFNQVFNNLCNDHSRCRRTRSSLNVHAAQKLLSINYVCLIENKYIILIIIITQIGPYCCTFAGVLIFWASPWKKLLASWNAKHQTDMVS